MSKVLLTTWDWKPSVILGCAVFLIYYLVLARKFKATSLQISLFTTGTLLMFLALVSPLDTLGDYYLFSAHMLQHLLLILVVPPLWLWGIPAGLLKRLRRRLPFINKVERVIAQPIVAWILGVGTIWVWHLPLLFEATLQNEWLHILEHLTFLATSVIFWWVVMIGPAQAERRLKPWLVMVYLFFAAIASSILGVILAFSSPGLYSTYLHPTDLYGILPTLRQTWGFSATADQQTGGILMWVMGSPFYLAGCLGALGRWYKESELETAREIAAELEAERLARQVGQTI